MNVKCTSDSVTVFPPGRGYYDRTINQVTIGNVYEVVEVVRQDYYEILPDEGLRTIELPSYMFYPTEELVTVNEDREKNEKKCQERFAAEREEEQKRQQQEISDALDRYYN
jgi:hypothetical protein